MIRFARAATLASLLAVGLALPACAAGTEDDVDSAAGAVIQLPSLDVSSTVRAFQTDPTAKTQLADLIATEKRNEIKRQEHAAASSNARARLDTAKRNLKQEKREWKAIAPKKRCWIFFKCTDWTGAVDVEAAKAEVKAARSNLHNLPSLNLEPVEPIANMIDRFAKIHDPAGYAKVAPINGDLALLERPASSHVAHIKDVQASLQNVKKMVQARQERLDKLGDAPATGDVEEALEAQTEDVETALDDTNLAIRGLGDTFFVLEAALRRDPNYSTQTFPSLPRAIDPVLTNFPNDLTDRDAQAARTREILNALSRVEGSLESHASGLREHQRDVAESRKDALDWLKTYVDRAEPQIRRGF